MTCQNTRPAARDVRVRLGQRCKSYRTLLLMAALLALLSGCGPPSGSLVWRTKSEADRYFAPPVALENTLFEPASGGNFLALDVDSGKKRWQSQILGGVDFPPTIWQHYLLVAGNIGVMRMLDQATGREKWQYNTHEAPLSALVVADQGVFVVTRTHLWCLDPRNGRLKWVRTVQRPRRMEPLVGGGWLYLGTNDRILVFDARTGRLANQIGIGGESSAPMTLADGQLFNIAGNGYLQVFSLGSFKEGWHLSLRGPAVLPMSYDHGYLYVASGGDLQSVIARHVLWTYQAKGLLATPLVTDADSVYAVATEGGLIALDKSTGSVRWFKPLPRRTIGYNLSIGRGTVYAGYTQEESWGGVMAVATRDGKVIWQRQCAGGLRAPPVAQANTAYFGTVNGEIYAVRP